MDSASVQPSRGPQWALWAWAGVTLALGGWVFYPILVYDPHYAALAEIWATDDNYSYGFLVPPLALFFAWERRDVLRSLPQEGSVWGLVVIGFALVLFGVGVLGGVNFLPRLSAIVLLFGAIVWIAGWPWARELAFPVGFLLLMIPVPRFVFIQIAFPLQVFASVVAEHVLFWFGVPILREGNVIHLPHTQLEVAEACSGLRSLLALITTGVVFAYFFGRGWIHWIVIVLLSIPIAIFVNALRVTGTGYLAFHYGVEVATGYYHMLEGFAMFGLAFSLLASLGFLVISVLPAGGGESS